MATRKDWNPGTRDGQAAMAKNWSAVLSAQVAARNNLESPARALKIENKRRRRLDIRANGGQY
ncbi:MAG: hypothetical protein LBD58_04060 [Treponema sp.]|jgi:hypothetical protein|nr:hypothetical protein [Treponema sp.]